MRSDLGIRFLFDGVAIRNGSGLGLNRNGGHRCGSGRRRGSAVIRGILVDSVLPHVHNAARDGNHAQGVNHIGAVANVAERVHRHGGRLRLGRNGLLRLRSGTVARLIFLRRLENNLVTLRSGLR